MGECLTAPGGHTSRRRVCLGALAIVAGVLVAHAAPMQTTQGVATVVVDFTASQRGEVVTELTTADVTLRVDGRERSMTSLQFVRVAGPPRDVSADPFVTNRPTADGRTILFVMDLLSIRAGREAPLRAAIRELAAALQPSDRIALASVPYDGLIADFTTDHPAVIQRMVSATGRALRAETPSEFTCRSRVTLESLRGLLESLGGGVGPTTVVLIASALAGPSRDALATQFPGQCELRPLLFQDVAEAAAVARARMYVVEPEDTPSGGTARAGLEHLAGVTGGDLLTLSGAGARGLVRIADETAMYYLLTFESAPHERNGALHRVELHTRRPGVSIQVRPEIRIPKWFADAPVSRRVAADLLTDPRHFRDVSLRGTLFLSRDADASLIRVVPLVEAPGDATALASAAIGVYAADGRLVAQWASAPGVDVLSPIAGALSVPRGRYRVRVAVTSRDGRSGVLDQDLDAILDGRGPWLVSSVILGLSRDGVFAPRLQFTDQPVVIARVEVFGPAPTAGLVRFELARSPEGPALVSVDGTITATGDPTRHIASGAIPIGGFPNGRWTVRAVVSPQGLTPLRMTRTLDKTGRD